MSCNPKGYRHTFQMLCNLAQSIPTLQHLIQCLPYVNPQLPIWHRPHLFVQVLFRVGGSSRGHHLLTKICNLQWHTKIVTFFIYVIEQQLTLIIYSTYFLT